MGDDLTARSRIVLLRREGDSDQDCRRRPPIWSWNAGLSDVTRETSQ